MTTSALRLLMHRGTPCTLAAKLRIHAEKLMYGRGEEQRKTKTKSTKAKNTTTQKTTKTQTKTNAPRAVNTAPRSARTDASTLGADAAAPAIDDSGVLARSDVSTCG